MKESRDIMSLVLFLQTKGSGPFFFREMTATFSDVEKLFVFTVGCYSSLHVNGFCLLIELLTAKSCDIIQPYGEAINKH